MSWVCDCAKSAAVRLETHAFNVMTPHGMCPDCGRDYAAADWAKNMKDLNEADDDRIWKATYDY